MLPAQEHLILPTRRPREEAGFVSAVWGTQAMAVPASRVTSKLPTGKTFASNQPLELPKVSPKHLIKKVPISLRETKMTANSRQKTNRILGETS